MIFQLSLYFFKIFVYLNLFLFLFQQTLSQLIYLLSLIINIELFFDLVFNQILFFTFIFFNIIIRVINSHFFTFEIVKQCLGFYKWLFIIIRIRREIILEISVSRNMYILIFQRRVIHGFCMRCMFGFYFRNFQFET